MKTASIVTKTGRLVSARLVSNKKAEVLMTSSNGQVVRISLAQVPVLKRDTQGVKLINVKSGDALAAVAIIEPDLTLNEEILDAATVSG